MPHALVVPAKGQGHINPCMLLAKSLASLGFKVSFVYFSSEYAELKAKKRLQEAPQLDSLQPVQAEGTEEQDLFYLQAGAGGPCVGDGGHLESRNIHIHMVEDAFSPGDSDKLFFVTPAMQENLFNLIAQLREQGGAPVTCLIADLFAPWTVHVAERARIPLICYWPCTAMAYLMLYDLPLLFSQGILPERGSTSQWKRETPLMLNHIPSLPPFSTELFPKDVRFGDASSPVVCLLGQIFSCGRRGERILIHTLSELETDVFHALHAVGINAYAVGPLLHHTRKKEAASEPAAAVPRAKESDLSRGEESDCISWLNTQADLSVIYVAFGSLVNISAEDIQELALGLEASRNPFLWVIRQDSCGSGQEGMQVLPKGFSERISGKGMIISWAPQMEVLAHRAIGGFLSHCGWNSALESLWGGVPMLCCPIFAEQLINAHYICNVWGVGVELGRIDTGAIERRNVEVGVKGLMQGEQGRQARAKAQEVMKVARRTCQQGGKSFSNLQRFYDDMKVCANGHVLHKRT